MRLRTPVDLQQDPNFNFMVGRLVGASEMMARYLQIHGDEKGKGMGTRVDALLTFFYERTDIGLKLPPEQP